MGNYILDENGNAVREPDLMKFAAWFATTDRTIAKTKLDNIVVSTVFLGIDHSLKEHDLPILWETMIFGGEHDSYQERYTSRAKALAGHEKAVGITKGKPRPTN